MASINIIENKKLLNLKAMPKLSFTVDNKGFVKYGKNNLYPQELIRLYNEHPEHRAIIKRKARYIWGKGLKAVNAVDEIKVNAFIDNFNKKETLNQVGKKISENTEIFNGQYIEIITNLSGEAIEMYFLNSANCRISEDGETLFFSKDWKKNQYNVEIKEIKKWNDKEIQVGTFFIDFKYYSASASRLESIYPVAQYQSIVEDINTDIAISVANSTMVNNGLSMGKIIVFFNGKPDDKMVATIDRGFKGTYTGEDGEAVMVVHSEREDKAPEVIDVTPTDMAERFLYTSKRAQKKIFAGHEMASELFNIKFDDSFLSGSPDLLTLQELFVKGYIEPRQSDLLEFLSYLSFIKTGEYLEMMFEPISLIGADLSNDVDLTQDERRKLKGYEPLKPVQTDINGQPVQAEADEYNEMLTGLSATDRNDIDRIVRKFKSGKTESPDLAIASLTAYGFKVSQVKKFLGINDGLDAKMSSQVDSILMAFESIGTIEDPSTYTVLKREKVKFKSQIDALKYERQIMKFADALVISVEELDNAILNALKGNPILSIDELAELTQSDFAKVEESIARLIKNGSLESNSIGFKPTEKAIEKETKPIVSDEIYTVYKYEVNDEKPSLKKGGSSRPFCKKLMSLNKEYSFEEIDGISLKGVGENVGGTNIWDFRGGYYTNPETKVVDPDCRHIWVAETRLRKVKK
jgi:type III secretion system FlhB-like substrate exporter